MKIREYPTQQEIRNLFEYDDDAQRMVNDFLMRGALLRKKTGKLVFGSMTEDPRSRAMIGFPGGRVFYLHRVIWVLHHGEPPEGVQVDHWDTDAGHNRVDNLRLLTCSQNQMNRKKSRAGAQCRYIGVTIHNPGFGAYISDNGKPVYLGYFRKAEDAARVRDLAAFKKYGEVARLNRDLFDIGD